MCTITFLTTIYTYILKKKHVKKKQSFITMSYSINIQASKQNKLVKN